MVNSSHWSALLFVVLGGCFVGSVFEQTKLLKRLTDVGARQVSSKHMTIDHKEYDCVDENPTQFESEKEKLNVLVTGGAGFVGMHTSIQLKELGHEVVAYDSVNAYYSTDLKNQRIKKLENKNVHFVKGDVCDAELLESTMSKHKIDRVIHLAAQAGVRYSLDHPLEYVESNVRCFVILLESMAKLNMTSHPLVYASSSSVYGLNKKVPFSEKDDVSKPASLYAATKRSNELIAQTYYNLYGLNSVGLRFFTVYGPWGRPDMAYYTFVDRIMRGEPLKVYNHGKMLRDFTYIDDVVSGVIASLFISTKTPEVVNLGNNKPVKLMDFLDTIQKSVNKSAIMDHVGMQQGDVPLTYADIDKAQCLLGYDPSTSIDQGIQKFADWFLKEDGGQYANPIEKPKTSAA